MLKRRIIRGSTLVLALFLANLAVSEWAKENELRQKGYEVAQSDVLSQNVLEENSTAENREGRKKAEGREEDFVSKTESYPYLYAKGEVTKQELPVIIVFNKTDLM